MENMKDKKAALLLLPNLLGENKHHEVFLPSSVDAAVKTLDGIIAESEQGGRRFLGHTWRETRVHFFVCQHKLAEALRFVKQ